MLNTQNFISSFLKATLFTTTMIVGLLAQSYATTALFSDTKMKMNVAFSSESEDTTAAKSVSLTVQNDEESSITFGQHQLDIKTTFIAWDDDAKEHEQVYADVKILKVNEEGIKEMIGQPSLLILRNKWAEIKVDAEDNQEGFELKMQYEDLHPTDASINQLNQPIWLNWGDETSESTTSC